MGRPSVMFNGEKNIKKNPQATVTVRANTRDLFWDCARGRMTADDLLISMIRSYRKEVLKNG